MAQPRCLGHDEHQSQHLPDTVKDIVSNDSDSKNMNSPFEISQEQELDEQTIAAIVFNLCERRNIDVRKVLLLESAKQPIQPKPPENSARRMNRVLNSNPSNSTYFSGTSLQDTSLDVYEDMKHAVHNMEYSIRHNKKALPPVNNPARNNNFAGLASSANMSEITGLQAMDDAICNGFDPNLSIMKGQCEDAAVGPGFLSGCLYDEERCLRKRSNLQSLSNGSEVHAKTMDPFSTCISLQQSRMAGPQECMNFVGEKFLTSAGSDDAIMPVLPPKNDILRGLIVLPSDIEKIHLKEIKQFTGLVDITLPSMQPEIQALPGDQFHTLQNRDGVMGSSDLPIHRPSPSPLHLSQGSNSSLDSLSQMQNQLPVGSNGSSEQSNEPGWVKGPSRDLRSTSRTGRKRKITTRTFPGKCDETQEPQETPNKTFRCSDDTDMRMTPYGFQAASGASSSDTESGFAWATPGCLGAGSLQQHPLKVEQQLQFQTNLKPPAMRTKQPAMPPDEACRVETRSKLGQKIWSRRAEQGHGPLSIDWDPKPEIEQTPAEREKKERRRQRNRETARRAREQQRNLEMQLQQDVKNRKSKLESVNDEIAHISRQMMDLQTAQSAHYMYCHAWHRPPVTNGPVHESSFPTGKPLP